MLNTSLVQDIFINVEIEEKADHYWLKLVVTFETNAIKNCWAFFKYL